MDPLSLLMPAILFGLVSLGLRTGYKNYAMYLIITVAISQWYFVLLGGAGSYLMSMPSMVLKTVWLWASVVAFLLYTGRTREAMMVCNAVVLYTIITTVLVKYFGFSFEWLPVLMQ